MANKKYDIIYADPAWRYSDWNYKQNETNDFLYVSSSKKRSPSRHYQTMTVEQIKLLNIQSITSNNSVLFIWVLNNMLKEGIDVLESWGFSYKTVAFSWVKRNKKSDSLFWGMGGWTRSNVELCLLGIKGHPKRMSAGVHSVVFEPVGKHSKKPEIVRNRIVDLMGDISRVELFAREKIKGWDSWGNEIESDIEI